LTVPPGQFRGGKKRAIKRESFGSEGGKGRSATFRKKGGGK